MFLPISLVISKSIGSSICSWEFFILFSELFSEMFSTCCIVSLISTVSKSFITSDISGRLLGSAAQHANNK